MFALGISVLAALPVICRRGKVAADFCIIGLGILTAMWFGWRAWNSPAAEYGQADLLLLCGAVAAFVSIRGIAGNVWAERILGWGVALLLLANLIVIGIQIADPTYSPIFRTRSGPAMISGFFAHYNEAANYLIASSMLVGAAAMFGRHSLPVKILWGLIALAGLAGVWFTHSRGGILGAAVACGVFAAVFLIIAKRRESKWFAPMLIAIPLIGLAIGAFLFMGWEDAQEARKSANTTVTALLDNNCRLYFLGIAMSCIGLHPMNGGGSRSFSWECFAFVDGNANGDIITHRPDMVHNEIMQAATDYGLIGAGLLVGLLITFIVTAILRALFEKSTAEKDGRDAWRLGALAAFAGMLVQSCFSFVFHLLPGILLLGICLGQMTRSNEQAPSIRTLVTRIFLCIAGLICVCSLIPAAWKGSQVTRILWPTYFSKQAVNTPESRIDALSEAIQVWPHSEFYQDRAGILQESMISLQGNDLKDAGQRALDDYQQAARLQPFEPGHVSNRAILLSNMQRDVEAEDAYAKAIRLQGGMEPAYRVHFVCANHYLAKGLRLWNPENPEPALKALELSAEHIESSAREMHWIIADMREPRIIIHEKLGTAREAAGNPEGALECYNFASALPGGTRAHYLAGVLLGKKAVATWAKRRPGPALFLFMEAKKRVGQAGNQLPKDVTPSQRAKYLNYLDRQIAFLKGAKVVPVKE
ncbi:MAG: O-antigen ligase family protein [Verrucomicrobiota bacterium]